ncbi:MAG: hypothetical protein IJX93_04515 [Clostridia bacterium]|nr:hypothetical protein [Clostridia bacterium]
MNPNKQRLSWLRALWLVTLASVVTLACFIASYLLILFLAAATEDQQFLRFLIAGVITAVGYVFLLNHMVHRQDDVTDQLERDYRGTAFAGWKNDFRIMLDREFPVIAVMISVIVVVHISNLFIEIGNPLAAIYLGLNILSSAFGLILPEPWSTAVSLILHLTQCAGYLALSVHKRKKAYAQLRWTNGSHLK